ncbi:MAG TPA: DUF4105 domain-containing protein, partial [Thermoanaerobaculia bacterium]|nr:DUF4105 domain-containing protein [Thermoanaerobaculia bacterium]
DMRLRRFGRALFVIVIIAVLPFLFARLRTPSNARQWTRSQRVLPRVVVRGELVEVRNVRELVYRTEEDFDARYATRAYDLRKLDSVWYVVSRFSDVPGMAHSFLTFGFGDEYVAISVEARREEGESYGPLRGMLREYELLYVIGAESDVIGLRTNVWKEGVSLYPIRTTPEKMREAFVGMTRRAESLAVAPEFYNTITNSCISNIVGHVEDVAPDTIRLGIGRVLPGYSDRIAYDAGLIATDLPFDRIEGAFRIDAAAQRHGLGAGFSEAIREGLGRR